MKEDKPNKLSNNQINDVSALINVSNDTSNNKIEQNFTSFSYSSDISKISDE